MHATRPLSEDDADRPLGRAVRRGLLCRCPKCGEGKLLHRYLKVRDACPSCGEAFHHQRADDGPAWLTLLIVGHLMAPALHIGYVRYEPEPLVLFAVLSSACLVLSLVLLPRLKGMMVAFQWSRRMHGFSRP
ncbi:MAG: DUF983 domain-containing protein [Pseudomonadota bacterium]